MRTAKEVAESIRNAETWDPEDCEELCKLAGLEKEWEESDAYTFESVIEKAAKILGVEIY